MNGYQKWLSIHFLFLSKNHKTNFVLKIPVANSCRLILHRLILCMAGVWPPEIAIVYVLRIKFFGIKFQSTSETIHEAFNFSADIVAG